MAGAMFSNALKSFSSNITANYFEKSASPVSFCGPWKIYDAKKKKTNQPVSIFVFDRKSLDSGSSGSGLSLRGSSSSGLRTAQDEVVERLKSEASLLARLRHPCVLELVEPVEETRSGGLQFVTELVTGSLATLLVEKDEEERDGGGRYVRNDGGRRRRREVEIDELEIQKGLLQVGKALEFLHESANLIHGNLTPEAVMVNAKSDWKICGLSFTTNSTNPSLPPQFDHRLPPNVQLQLNYAAPDLVLDQTLSTSCDMFSLGLLIVALYNYPHKSPLESHNSSSDYRRILSSLQTTPNGSNNFLCARPIPRQLTGTVLPQLITRRPAGRMTARDFQQSEYFDNILVSTLRFLDSFPAKTPSEKAAFMRGLPKILPQFPRSVLEKKILPGLVEELRDGSMLALILPNIFAIVENASSRIFSDKVLKRLKEVFIPLGTSTASTSEPKTAAGKMAEREKEASKEGGLTAIISKLGVIKEKTTAQEFKEDVLPLVQLALESSTHSLQDLALRSLPVFLPKLDFPTLKNDLFPIVTSVFTKTSSLGIKIRGLEAFRVLCGGAGSDDHEDGLNGFSTGAKGKSKGDEAPVLDKYTIQEKVIPLLKAIKTKEPAVMMEALSVFNEIGQICDREVVAMDILPTLWTMSFGPLLGLEQFKSFMFTIKSLSQKIESEQIRKLSELSTTTQGVQSAGDFLSFGGAPGLNAMNGRISPGLAGETDFERLVFGKKDTNSISVSNGFDRPGASTSTAAARTSTSSMQSMRAKSPANITTAAPKFSWSTPSPTTPRAGQTGVSLNSVLAPSPAPSSTPSQSSGMGAFSLLQPAKGGVGFGSTTGMRPQPGSGSSGGVNWAEAAKPVQSFPPPSQPMGQMMAGLNLGSTASSQAPGLNELGGLGGMGTTAPMATGIKKGGGIQLTNFGGSIPAAPTQQSFSGGLGGMGAMGGMGGGGMNTNTNTMGRNMNASLPGVGVGALEKEEKKGLDKWESLL